MKQLTMTGDNMDEKKDGVKLIPPRELSKGDMKILKRRKVVSTKLKYVLKDEAMVRTDDKSKPYAMYADLKDASDSKIIKFFNSTNKHRLGQKNYNAEFMDRDTGLLIKESPIEAKDLYEAKEKARELGKKEGIKNFKLRVKYV